MKLYFSLFVMLFLVFRPAMPLVEYVVNYDYIQKNLCENRERVEIRCNGKCYLVKQLAKTNEGSTDGSSMAKYSSLKYAEIFLPTDIFSFPTCSAPIKGRASFFYSDAYTYMHTALIFHPPLI